MPPCQIILGADVAHIHPTPELDVNHQPISFNGLCLLRSNFSKQILTFGTGPQENVSQYSSDTDSSVSDSPPINPSPPNGRVTDIESDLDSSSNPTKTFFHN